jgi:signal transduction histidine kinase
MSDPKTRDGSDLQTVLAQKTELQSRIEKQKIEFDLTIHGLAHDLQSPLTTILAMTELLEARLHNSLDHDSEEYFQAIIKTCMRSSQNIAQMLNLYKATERKVEKKLVNLSEECLEIADLFCNRPEYKKTKVHIEPGIEIYADPGLIRLVLENLLDNAFKYSHKSPHSQVEVYSLPVEGDLAGFAIRDNGVGFDASSGPRLFQPLVRLHGENEFPGTGLGLSSVSRIIERHEGTVQVEGAKEKGATVFVRLPINRGVVL